VGSLPAFQGASNDHHRQSHGWHRHVWLVIVYDADGEPLNADQFPDTDAGYKAATARENELQTILSRNRQAMLF